MVMNRHFRTVKKDEPAPEPQEQAPEEPTVRRRRRKRDDQGNLMPLEDEDDASS